MWFTYSSIVKREFVKFFQKLFSQQKIWENYTYPVLDLSQDNIIATENYAFRGEKYPAIIVSAEGGQLLIRDLQDSMGDYYHEEIISNNPIGYTVIGKTDSGVASASVSFTPSRNFSLEQVNILMANSGLYSQGNVNVKLYNGGAVPSSGTLLASGSLDGFSSIQSEYKLVGFDSKVSLNTANTYWITVEPDDINSSYYLYTDDSISNNIAVSYGANWSETADTALCMWLRGDSAIIYGGDVKLSINVQIAARDEKTVSDIFDLCLLFTELAKKVGYSKFHEHKIKIESISFGGETAPIKTGTNTNIFVRTLTVSVIAGWTYDIDKELLKDFGYIINTF